MAQQAISQSLLRGLEVGEWEENFLDDALLSAWVIQSMMHFEIYIPQAKAVEALHASTEIEVGWPRMWQGPPTLIPNLSVLRDTSTGILRVN
jgi:hypothetical protein